MRLRKPAYANRSERITSDLAPARLYLASGTFVVVLVLCVYLVQRSLTDLISAGPQANSWSPGAQVNWFSLRLSYVTMTIAWPLVLGGLCAVVGGVARRQARAHDFVCSEWAVRADPESTTEASCTRQPGRAKSSEPLMWRLVSTVPLLTLGLHLASGMTSLRLMLRLRGDAVLGFTAWPASRVGLAFAVLVLAVVVGTLGALRFRSGVRWLRDLWFDDDADGWFDAARASDGVPATGRQDVAGSDPRTVGWQVSISSKKLDADGRLARDAVLAIEVYEALEQAGLRTFNSSRSLELLGASAYKRAIDDALDQCPILVAVGTSVAHLDSAWVRYEWDSFLNEILSGHKPAGRVFVYVEGVSDSVLPRPLRQTQVLHHGPDGIDSLIAFVRNALGSGGAPS